MTPSNLVKVIIRNTSLVGATEIAEAGGYDAISMTIRAKVNTVRDIIGSREALENIEDRPDNEHVFIDCWLDTVPTDTDGTVRLMVKDAKILKPKRDDILLITIIPIDRTYNKRD